MTPGRLIVAYHGCDVVTRDDLVARRLEQLEPSANDYDWLGPGVYFFEDDARRAYKFAAASAKNPARRFSHRPIVNPAVVGALICVQSCLDMTGQDGLDEFREVHAELTGALARKGHPMPVNAFSPTQDPSTEVHLLRKLDCAVFYAIHDARAKEKLAPYQLVRGAFPQGEEIAPRSFRADTHIQLALRDPACIVGWFAPEGTKMLPADAYDEAVRQRDAAQASPVAKPRVRAQPIESKAVRKGA